MGKMKKRVLAVHKLTGTIIGVYPSVHDASEATGKTVGYIAKMARDKQLPKDWTCFRYESTYDPKEQMAGRMNCPVAIYQHGKLTAEFPNRVKVAEVFDVAGYTIDYYIRTGKEYRGCKIQPVPFMGALGGRLADV